jgi:hypothetical protein
MEPQAIGRGTVVKEVATSEVVYQNCTVVRWDTVGLAFATQRTVTEGGDVETVVSQVFVPWTNIQHVVIKEDRT